MTDIRDSTGYEIQALKSRSELLAEIEGLKAANEKAYASVTHRTVGDACFGAGMERAAVIIDAMGQPKEGSAAIRAEVKASHGR